MSNKIRTKKQRVAEQRNEQSISLATKQELDKLYKTDFGAFEKILKEKTGISTMCVVCYQFVDTQGCIVGDTLYDSVDDILADAGIEVALK